MTGFSVQATGNGEMGANPVQDVLEFIKSPPNYVQAEPGSH
jgi:hypothetical protein